MCIRDRFYTALIGYIWYEAPAEEMNFTTLLEMINASEAREDDPEFQSPVDLMFERLEQKDPDHFAVRQYKKFLLSAGKTRSSILISCGARLAPFDIQMCIRDRSVCHGPQAAALALRRGGDRSTFQRKASWRTNRPARYRQQRIRLLYDAPPLSLSLIHIWRNWQTR